KSEQAFSPPRSGNPASFLEEVMMSLLDEFNARWLSQDKQSATGRKMAESNFTFSGGQLEGRPRWFTCAGQAVILQENSTKHFDTFSKLRSTEVLLQFSVWE
ncbi:hypothetical protein ABVT39_014776, partial [Epinephelus coioides]